MQCPLVKEPHRSAAQFTVCSNLDGTSSQEGSDDGDDVDGQLELKELCDAVVDVTAPHDSLHDTCKIVVC